MPGINPLSPGRALANDVGEFNRQKRDFQNAPRKVSEPEVADIATARYGAAYNSTTNTPSDINDGILGPGGRMFAEVQSLTAAAGTPGVQVTLHAGSKGVRALVGLSASTITAGQVRWWIQDPQSRTWFATAVVDVLPTGVQGAATPDQLLTVGAK